MALDVSGLTAQLQTLLPKVQFYLDERYRAGDNDNHRELLREKIAEITGDQTVLDLSAPPSPRDHYVSISHCRVLGGFALARQPVGFDIEETARVRLDIVERMGHPNDVQGPWPAAVWAAKEAAFKSLGKNQPQILSSVAVISWTPLGPCQYSFHTPQGAGIVVEFQTLTIAAFLTVSN